MGRGRVVINHGSVYARDPKRAAENLAALTQGMARPFHPCDGAWVCFLGTREEDWEGPLLEFYPRDVRLAQEGARLAFRRADAPPRGAGTHFNLELPATRKRIETACDRLALPHSWRDWQGLVEVWLEDEILIECVPGAAPTPKG